MMSTLVLYADTPQKNDVIFYTRVINSSAFDSCNENNCFVDFLADYSNSKSSKEQSNTKYIALKNNEFTKNDYIMVTVTSKQIN